MEKGIFLGDCESLHAPEAQGSATHAAGSSGVMGHVGTLADGAGPAIEKGANFGG